MISKKELIDKYEFLEEYTDVDVVFERCFERMAKSIPNGGVDSFNIHEGWYDRHGQKQDYEYGNPNQFFLTLDFLKKKSDILHIFGYFSEMRKDSLRVYI